MGESLDDWREFFTTTNTDLLEFINTAITIAALDRPRDFRLQRDRIMEQLFSTTTTQSRPPQCNDLPSSLGGGDDCVRASKESKRIRDNSRGVVERDGLDMNPEGYQDCGGAEAISDEIDEQSRVVGEVSRIKQVLDNGQPEQFDSVLYESLRKLQSMNISKDILEKTKIGITVNRLRREGGSTRMAQLARNIIMGWKAMVKEICRSSKDAADSYVDVRKVGIIDCASGPTPSVKCRSIHQHQATVKINSSGEVAEGKKLGASKRILQEHCQQAETAKRQRTVLALPAFPKQPTSHNGPGRRARIEKTITQMAKSRSRISPF